MDGVSSAYYPCMVSINADYLSRSDVAIWIIAGLSTLAFLIMIGVITAQSIASFRHKGNYVLGNSMMVPQ